MLIWLRKRSAAAPVVPPGFKQSDCSVTNESLLHGCFPFAGGTLSRMTGNCVRGAVSVGMETQKEPDSGTSYCWNADESYNNISKDTEWRNVICLVCSGCEAAHPTVGSPRWPTNLILIFH